MAIFVNTYPGWVTVSTAAQHYSVFTPAVFESAWHWYRGLLSDAGFQHSAARDAVISERRVDWVACHAALLDLRTAARSHPALVHPTDHRFCQSIGARIHREGHPGLLTPSVRRPGGENFAIFNPGVLSDPRESCLLTLRLHEDRIEVEKEAGVVWLGVSVTS